MDRFDQEPIEGEKDENHGLREHVAFYVNVGNLAPEKVMFFIKELANKLSPKS